MLPGPGPRSCLLSWYKSRRSSGGVWGGIAIPQAVLNPRARREAHGSDEGGRVHRRQEEERGLRCRLVGEERRKRAR